MAITKQDVWRVANEIDAAGDKPTAVEVRKRLGTGSYTTITAALKEWTRPDDEADAGELAPVPEEFEERMAQAGADLFAIAMKMAEERFQAERDQWAAERAELVAERDEAMVLADQVAAELDRAREVIDGLQKQNAMEVKQCAEAFAVAEERGRALQEARAEVRTYGERAERLQGRVEALEAVIETLKPEAKPRAKGKTVKSGDAGAASSSASVTNAEGGQ